MMICHLSNTSNRPTIITNHLPWSTISIVVIHYIDFSLCGERLSWGKVLIIDAVRWWWYLYYFRFNMVEWFYYLIIILCALLYWFYFYFIHFFLGLTNQLSTFTINSKCLPFNYILFCPLLIPQLSLTFRLCRLIWSDSDSLEYFFIIICYWFGWRWCILNVVIWRDTFICSY